MMVGDVAASGASSSSAAVLAAISGWLFAHFQRAVNPTPFSIGKGIEYLFMAVLGGVGSVWGAFVGAGAVRIIEDYLQVLLPKPEAADGWIKKPNTAPLFGGKSALDRMLSGQVADLYVVRQYLDAQRGG